MSSAMRPADVDGLDHRAVEAADRDHDPLVAVRRRHDLVRAQGEMRTRRGVLAVDEE